MRNSYDFPFAGCSGAGEMIIVMILLARARLNRLNTLAIATTLRRRPLLLLRIQYSLFTHASNSNSNPNCLANYIQYYNYFAGQCRNARMDGTKLIILDYNFKSKERNAWKREMIGTSHSTPFRLFDAWCADARAWCDFRCFILSFHFFWLFSVLGCSVSVLRWHIVAVDRVPSNSIINTRPATVHHTAAAAIYMPVENPI